MIKFLPVCIAMLLPFACNAGIYNNADSQDAEISRLMAEKQRKYAELEKCVKSVKGLKIAGISTIGLTAGGVALNIAQADKSKKIDNQIAATHSQIEKQKQKIEAQNRIQAESLPQDDAEPDLTNLLKIDETDDATELQENADNILNAPSPLTEPTETEEEEEIITTTPNACGKNGELCESSSSTNNNPAFGPKPSGLALPQQQIENTQSPVFLLQQKNKYTIYKN